MPLLLNEDKAIRNHMSGIVVSDDKNPTRPVGVWFGQPDLEIRAQSYPYMTIDLIDVVEDSSRSVQGVMPLTYLPEGWSATQQDVTNKRLESSMPIPLFLDYQVTTYARQPRHDRQIISEIISKKLPFRRGSIEITEDNTRRPVFLTSYLKRDMNEGGKRLFRNIFNLRVFSEMFLEEFAALQQVSEVKLSVQYSVNDTAPTSNFIFL